MDCGPSDFTVPDAYWRNKNLGSIKELIPYTTSSCPGAYTNTPWNLKVVGELKPSNKQYRLFVYRTAGTVDDLEMEYVGCSEETLGLFNYDIDDDFGRMPLIDRVVCITVFMQVFCRIMELTPSWHDCDWAQICFWPDQAGAPESCYYSESERHTPSEELADWLMEHKKWVIGGLGAAAVLSAAPLLLPKGRK